MTNASPTAMPEVAEADLKPFPSIYESSRGVWKVLIGEDAARPIINASFLGDDKALRKLLFQPQWTRIALEKQHAIYCTLSLSECTPSVPEVMAMPMMNLERAIIVAAINGRAVAVSTLLGFASEVGVDPSSIIRRNAVDRAIGQRDGAVFEALASADPSVVRFNLSHGRLPLTEAIKRSNFEVVTLILKLGANHKRFMPKVSHYSRPPLCLAAEQEDIAMTEHLLTHEVPIPSSGALRVAAELGRLDTMRLLIQHGADVNERLPEEFPQRYSNVRLVSGRTPMHYAASTRQVKAMKLLESNGALSDLGDKNGMTPAQLLEACE